MGLRELTGRASVLAVLVGIAPIAAAQVVGLGTTQVGATNQLSVGIAKVVSDKGGDIKLDDLALLLLDQAQILEGEPLADPAGFARRMAAVMERGL